MNIWTIKLNTRIIAGGVLLLSILIYGAVFFITNRKIGQIELEYSNTATNIALEEQARKTRDEIEGNIDYLEKLDKYFVEKGDEVVFIEEIESLLKSLSLEFDISSIDPVKPPGDNLESKEIYIKMNMKGNWQNLVTFIEKLEKLPFGVFVQGFTLDKPGGGAWEGSVEFLVFN